MSFALSGSHRSGKTTLAKAIAEAMKIPFFDTSTTKVARELGFDPVAPMTLDERLTMQEGLLARLEENLRRAARPFIADRSSIDMLGYMLAEVGMNNTAPETATRIEAYRKRCIKIASEQYDAILITRPLPFYTADPDKPPPNLAYQWHHQALVEGSMPQTDLPYSILLTHDAEERLTYACETFKRVIAVMTRDAPALKH